MPFFQIHPATLLRRPTLWLALMLGLLLSGCASVVEKTNVQEPSVSLANARIAGLSLDGVELVAILDIDNPNPFAIDLAGYDYSLTINNNKISGGQQRQGMKIGAKTKSQIEVPIKLNFSEIFKLVGGLSELDTIGYKVDATAYINVPVVGTRAISTSLGSTFPLPKRPDIGIKGIKINSFDFASADITLTLEVQNPNGFDIDLNQLDYRLTIGEEEWARAKFNRAAKLTAKGRDEIELPVKVNFFDIGGAIFKALKEARPLDYRLQGDMQLDTSLPWLKNLEIPFDQLGTIKPEIL